MENIQPNKWNYIECNVLIMGKQNDLANVPTKKCTIKGWNCCTINELYVSNFKLSLKCTFWLYWERKTNTAFHLCYFSSSDIQRLV